MAREQRKNLLLCCVLDGLVVALDIQRLVVRQISVHGNSLLVTHVDGGGQSCTFATEERRTWMDSHHVDDSRHLLDR